MNHVFTAARYLGCNGCLLGAFIVLSGRALLLDTVRAATTATTTATTRRVFTFFLASLHGIQVRGRFNGRDFLIVFRTATGFVALATAIATASALTLAFALALVALFFGRVVLFLRCCFSRVISQ